MNNKLQNIKRGTTFRFENKTWKVTEVYKIKWKDGTRSNEFKVKNDLGTFRYLEIETDKTDKKTLSFWKKETNKDFLFSKKPLDKYVTLGKAKFPAELHYNGVLYFHDETHTGTCNYGFETEQVDSLDYTNEDDTKLFSIELWDDEIEVSTGFPIKESDISNIIEGKSSIDGSAIWKFISKYIAILLIGAFILFSSLLKTCSSSGNWNGNNSKYENDSTRINRSNNYYRGRSGGFGK